VAAFGTVRVRQRRLEAKLERRFPGLYDARHAAQGLSRAVWPLLGPLLTALVVVPILALLAWLVAQLGLEAPSIDLPSVDLPEVPFPDVTAPGGCGRSARPWGLSAPPRSTSSSRARSSWASGAPGAHAASGPKRSGSAASSSCGAWPSLSALSRQSRASGAVER